MNIRLIKICFIFPLLALVACGGNNVKNQENSQEETSENMEVAEGGNGVITGINSTQFRIVDNMLLSDNLPLVIDFNATWCVPCKKYSPTFHAAAEKYANSAVFVSIDIDEYPKIAQAYKVQAVPTTIFVMPGGEVMGEESGIISPETLNDYINQLIDTSDGEDGSI